MTTRRLIAMRHAKSDWTTGEASDHARPLNKRGRRDAPRIGAELARIGWVPAAVRSSDSARTRETWARMAPELGADVEPVFSPALYHGGSNAFAEAVIALPDDVPSALVLGHNPHWEEMVSRLCGEVTRMTTANAALLVGEGDTWAQALAGAWTLERVVRPKEL